MGYMLRRWLADRLPADLSSGERLVALEIADKAWDETSIAYGKDLLETLTRRCGFSDVGEVRRVLRKLEARGIQLRVPAGYKDGCPFYAYKGHQSQYRIPTAEEMGLPDDLTWAPDPRTKPTEENAEQKEGPQAPLSQKEGPQAPLSHVEGGPLGAERRAAGPERGAHRPGKGGPQAPPTSQNHSSTNQKPLSRSGGMHGALLAQHGVPEYEREKLIKKIEELNKVETPHAWWTAASKRGWIPDCIVEARAALAADVASRPEWCGRCDEDTRLVDTTVVGHAQAARCADCHPNARRPAPSRPARRTGGHRPYRDSPTANYRGSL